MTGLLWIRIGAIVAGLGVAAGAFGAHAMASRLTPERLEVWKTAANYQLLHAVALVAIGAAWSHLGRVGHAAAPTMLAGVVVFSGSLYLLCLTGTRWLGAVTPLGGTAFLVAWTLLAVGASRGDS